MAEDQRIQEFTQACAQHDENKSTRIRLEEKLGGAKKNLQGTVEKIKKLGYDPKTFEQDISQLDEQLTKEVSEFTQQVKEEASALQTIEESVR
jgi:archaellum component FlaC